MTPDDDSRLLRAFQRRERPAFDALFARHAPGVFAFARHLTGSCEEAEEIVSETFSAAFVSAPRYLGRSRLSTWLLAIARRRVLDRVRQKRVPTERLLEDEKPLPSPHSTESQALASVALQAALARLDAPLKEAFLLVVGRGLTYREAAIVTKSPVGTVKWRIHEATRRLRIYLEEE